MNREDHEEREEKQVVVGPAGQKRLSFFAFAQFFAILSEQSERAVKNMNLITNRFSERRFEKRLNREDHEEREEKQVVVGPAGQKRLSLRCSLRSLCS